MNKIYILSVFFIIMLIAFIPVHNQGNTENYALSPVAPNVIITSNIGKEILDLPENSSNLDMFYSWDVSILASQSYTFSINGNITNHGIGPIEFHENMSKYTEVNVTIKIGLTIYSYSDISIIGVPPKVGIYNVFITTTYPGQDQILAIQAGKSGELSYPAWDILLESSNNESYSIYENGLKVASGSVLGTKNVYLNVTGNTTSVIVSLGTKIYNYKNELVAHIPISQYYKPKPPPLVATALDVAISFPRGIVIVFLAVLSGMILSRRYIIARKDMEPQRRW